MLVVDYYWIRADKDISRIVFEIGQLDAIQSVCHFEGPEDDFPFNILAISRPGDPDYLSIHCAAAITAMGVTRNQRTRKPSPNLHAGSGPDGD